MAYDYPAILTAFFFCCFGFSLLINYILLRFVQTLGVRGKEAMQVRWNPDTKPALGGISFYVVFLFSLIFTVLLANKSFSLNLTLLGILISGTLAFMMGLADDAFNTQPLLKFLTQIVCALVLIFSGHSIAVFENQFLNSILTVLWVVGMMNSINMLDNMDAISTIVAISACTFFAALNVSLFRTTEHITILNLGLLAALCGFLVFNFHPSKMFMGDTGSQFLGLFLAAGGIDNCWNSGSSPEPFGMPIVNMTLVALVFIVPLSDTATVVINRMWRGQSPFIGGKDHTTHHLFFRGVTEKRIALLYLALSGAGCFIAYQLIFRYSAGLLAFAITYCLAVFLSLYLNTVIRKGGKAKQIKRESGN